MPKRTAAPYPAPSKPRGGRRAGNPMLASRGVQKRTASVLLPFARSKRAYRDEYLLRAPSLAEVEEIRAGQLAGGSLPGAGLSGGVLPGPRAQIYGVQEPGLIDRYRRSIREAEGRRAPDLAPGAGGAAETSDAQVQADFAATEAAAEKDTGAPATQIKTEADEPGADPEKTPLRPSRLFPSNTASFASPGSALVAAEQGVSDIMLETGPDGKRYVRANVNGEEKVFPVAALSKRGGVQIGYFRAGGPRSGLIRFTAAEDSILSPSRLFTDNALAETPTQPETGLPLESPVATLASGSRPEDLGTRSIGGVETPAVPPSSDVARYVSEIVASVAGGRPDVAVVQRNANVVRAVDSETQTEAVLMFGARNIVVLPPDADAVTRANALRIANEQALLKGGRKVIVAPGYELQPAIQKIAKRLQRASSQSYINRNPSGGFLVYKPGGNQVLAAVPAAKGRLDQLEDRIQVRRATRILPRDILAEMRVQQFADSIRQRRIGPPSVQFEDAGVRRQFAGGSAGASMVQDWRESRSSDRQRYLGGR